MKGERQRVIDWFAVIGYVFLLLVSAGFVPLAWAFLERHFPWHSLLPQGVAGLFLILFIRYLPERSLKRYVFFIVGGAFFFAMNRLDFAIEQIHFVEYGLLSIVLFRGFRHSLSTTVCYGASFTGSLGIGFLDEWLQGILPNRVCDPRDIWVNTLAGGLGLALLACTGRPSPKG